MNRKEQQFLRQRQTTRQLMGVTRLTEHGAVCGRDELLFYLLRPDNLSDRKSTRLNSSHIQKSRMPSSA